MTKKKKISLFVMLFLLSVIFLGIGVIVRNTTMDDRKVNSTEKDTDSDDNQKENGRIGNKKEAEKLLDQTVTREEIEKKLENGTILKWMVQDAKEEYMPVNFSMIIF